MKIRRYVVHIIDVTTSEPAHVHRRCFTWRGAKRSKDRVRAQLDEGRGTYMDHLSVYVQT